MSTLLASFILLKSNATGKFLCYGKDKADGTTTTLSFSQDINLQQEGSAAGAAGDQLVAEPAAAAGGGPEDFHLIKFEVEEAKTAPGLVHIRTCYNNKYWVRKCLESNSITAEANEAEEDQSKPTCTLFKPVFVGEEEEDNYLFANKYGNGKPPQKIQLIHVSQFGQLYVGVENDNGSIRTEQLIAASSDNSLNPTYFTAYDVTSNIVIPGRFTLMGLDGKYISGFQGFDLGVGSVSTVTSEGTIGIVPYEGNVPTRGNIPTLGFVTTDVGGRNVAMWTYDPTVPRYLPIKINNSTGLLWTVNRNNDVGLVSGNTTTSFFAPVKAGNDHVALHARLTGNFVHRVNAGSYEGVSARTMNSITEQTRLRIGEPVLSRTVSEPFYDLANARIYNTGDFQMYTDSRENRTSVEQTGKFEVEYETSRTFTWNQSLTVNIGVTFSMSVGIPTVGSAGVETSTNFESSTQWGRENTETRTIRYTQDVTLPPSKRVILSVLSSRSTCDVPLVCKVRDVMTDGTVREYTKTDILFTGVNSFNFNTVLESVAL